MNQGTDTAGSSPARWPHSGHGRPAAFTLDETRLGELAGRYDIETDHDALLALEAVIQGDGDGAPLLAGPCEAAVDLLTDADGEIDGYRVLVLLPGEPWLASGIQIIRDFARTANSLLAQHRHRGPVTAAGIVLTRYQLREWAGLDLTDDDLARLAACIPRSSIPAAVGAIVCEAMGRPAAGQDGGEGRRPCSCGTAWADAPGHDDDIQAAGGRN